MNLLLLLLAANGAPIVLARLLGAHAARPVDAGATAWDGRPLLGRSKTWRGVAGSLSCAGLLSLWMGYGIGFGLVFGSLVVVGDLLSSFVKRRRGLASSARSIGWDHLPESLLPTLYAVQALGQPWWWALLVSTIFVLIGTLATGTGQRGAGRPSPR